MGHDTIACTIIARNYAAQARTWTESVVAADPRVRCIVLLVDEPFGSRWGKGERFQSLGIAEIGLPSLMSFAFRYGVTEFSTAVKPWLLADLLERYEPRTLYYFDPDIVVFDSPRRLDSHLEDADVLLTPHLLLEEGGRHHRDLELAVLRAGTYNLGFLGLRNGDRAREMLRWWQQRLQFDCVSAPERGLFVDQRWIDLAAGGLGGGVKVLQDRGCNVAYWNLHQRRISRCPGGEYSVDGSPLRFFHFSGYSPAKPERVSRHLPNLQLADRPDVRPLFFDYCARLARNGFFREMQTPYRFDFFADGTPVHPVFRSLYRATERRLPGRWANPFAVVGDSSFPIWAIREPEEGGLPPLLLHLLAVRPDLRLQFAGALASPSGPVARAFREWFDLEGEVEFRIPPWWRAAATQTPHRADRPSTIWFQEDEGLRGAAAWLIERLGADPLVRAATDAAALEKRLRQLTLENPHAEDRSHLQRWLATRPLRRIWSWYGSRIDAHAAFQEVARSEVREEFGRWLLAENRRLELWSGEDVSLFCASLTASPMATAASARQSNHLLRRSRDGANVSRNVRRAAHDLPNGERPLSRGWAAGSGVNLVGYYDACSGIGEAARSTVQSVRTAGLGFAVETLPTGESAETEFLDRHDDLVYDTTLLNLNAENLLAGWGREVAESLRDTHRVGIWFWELATIPERFRPALGLVEELWARSRFIERALRGFTEKPVVWIPLGISDPSAAVSPNRERYGFRRGETVFFASCDTRSFLERKNPLGAIDAFREARFPRGRARLILRLANGDESTIRGLHERAGEADLLVLADPLSRREYLQLMASCDAFVSLHRSEGFGVPLAEAMLLGRPVVATGYGGNADFTTPSGAFLVDYALVPIGRQIGPYPAEAHWAEPDLRSAVDALRRIVSDPAIALERAREGQKHVRSQHGHEAVARSMARHIEEARSRPTRGLLRGATRNRPAYSGSSAEIGLLSSS